MTSSTAASSPDSRGGRVVLLMLLGLVVLAAVGYGAAYAVAGDKVPRGATVAGVEVGGLEPDAAEQRLRDALADREAAPVRVRVADESESLDPAKIGLAVDYPASVEEAGAGRSWHPARLWEYYTGGTAHEAALDVDDARLDAAAQSLAERVDRPPVEGEIVFERAQAQPIFPEAGRELDTDGAEQAMQEAFLGEDVVELPVDDVPPGVDEQAVREAMADFVEPALSGPVVVVFDGETEVRIRPPAYADALSVQPVDGKLVPQVDEKALIRGITPAMRNVGRRPRDASFEVVGGEPRVVPARRGVTYDRDELASQFLDHVTGEGDGRRIEIAAEVERPKLTTRQARRLGIEEEVSSFTTYFPHAEYRNVNLGRAAELIDGHVLEPGEVFSLNDTVGERTEENGFTEGFIISDGVFREDFGGGVSQIATTTFNAAFFAGLEDVEHKPHSFYIDRYPVGREATVAWGAIDLRFRNDTDHGVLIKASVSPSTPGSQGSATVTMYSTKVWDIGTDRSERHNITQPETRYLDTEDCVDNEGYGGFDIDVYRYFRRPGESEVVKRETFSTTYTPSDTVVCRPPPGNS